MNMNMNMNVSDSDIVDNKLDGWYRFSEVSPTDPDALYLVLRSDDDSFSWDRYLWPVTYEFADEDEEQDVQGYFLDEDGDRISDVVWWKQIPLPKGFA